jgi:hypothetical protein
MPCETDEIDNDPVTLGTLPTAVYPQYREPTLAQRVVEKLVVAGTHPMSGRAVLTELADAAELLGVDRGAYYDAVNAKVTAATKAIADEELPDRYDGRDPNDQEQWR